MLSLLNKSGGDKAASNQTIPWRPDFRNVEQLPDTKTVRTTFFVNVLAIGVAGTLALFVAHREWTASNLRTSLADVEARIASTTPGSEKAQAAYKLFKAEETKFTEAYALVKDPFRFPDFLIHLGTILPHGVSIQRIDHRGVGQTILINSSVKGLDAAASDVASNFVKQLQTDPVLAVHFSAISLTNLGRNADAGSLNLELVFTFATNASKGAVKK